MVAHVARRTIPALAQPLMRFAAVAVAAVTLAFPLAAGADGWPDLTAPPKAQGPADGDAAVIVAIEGYFVLQSIPGAEANGTAWYQYLVRSRGLRPSRVRLLLNREATREAILGALRDQAAKVDASGVLWFVFIGHGAPGPDDGLLVGADAQQSADGVVKRSVKRGEVDEIIATGKQAASVTVLDACFSGRDQAGQSLVPGLQPLVPTKLKGAATGFIMAAAGGDQFAGPLPGAERPAFSYLVLGALRGWGDRNGDRQVTAMEAFEYAEDTLASVLKGRSQTPESAGQAGGAVLSRTLDEPGPDVVKLAVRTNKVKVTVRCSAPEATA